MRNLFANGRAKRACKLLSISAIIALLASLCAASAMAQSLATEEQSSAIRTLLVFPFGNSAGDAGASAADQLAGAVQLRINAVGIYQATLYSIHLPAVQRALNVDNTLTSDDVKMPITDPATGQRIARICGTDGFVLGSLEGVTTQNNGQVRLTVSATVYDSLTGGSLKTVAVTGAAAPSYKTEDPGAVLSRAVQDAAGQLVSALNNGAAPQPRPSVIPASSNGSHNHLSAGGLVLIGLAIALVAVAASNAGATGGGSSSGSSSSTGSGSGGSGGGGSGPPPPPSAR